MPPWRTALCALVIVTATTVPARAQRSAEDELRALRPADGLQVELFAAEPLVVNPAAIDVDTRGRVWAAEIRYYRRAAREPGADRIVVLEDTDDDGRADRSTTFAEGLFCPMSICVAWPKIYVATSPDLWVYEDKNDDLKADGPPTKLLTGFGGHNHDHGAHSLVLGPDHKWWMSHGDEGFDVTGPDGSRIKFRWGATLRGELDGTQLETVAVNFRNPYEVCVSSFGEAYLSDNDNDGNFSTRICWLLEGGDYGWFGAPPAKVDSSIPFAEGWHFRAHIPGFVPATLVTGFGSPCGICFYEGDALGPEFHGMPLHAEAGPRELRGYRHEPTGFGQRATSRVFLTSAGDDYFRPDDVCAAPDGALYVSDWYDGGVGGHAYNNPTQGRIFRVRAQGERPARREKPGPYETVGDAIVGLGSPNLATQFLARERLLAEPVASVPRLVALLADSRENDPNLAARALWTLDRIGGEVRRQVLAELQASDPRFRALGVRILRRHGAEYGEQIMALADDPSPEVRREVLLALPKLPGERPLAVLENLAAAYTGSDRYELETLKIAARGRETALFDQLAGPDKLSAPRIQLLQLLDASRAAKLLEQGLTDPGVSVEARREIIRSMAANPAVDAGRRLLAWVADPQADATLRGETLALVDANLRSSWRDLVQDAALRDALAANLASTNLRVPVLAMIGRHGVADLAGQVSAIASDGQLESADRVAAIEALTALNMKSAPDTLAPLMSDGSGEVRGAALAALVRLQAWGPVRKLLTSTDGGEPAFKAVALCMKSAPGALVLLRLIDERKLSSGLQEAAVAAAATHADTSVRVLFAKYLPPEARPVPLGSAIKPDEILTLDGDATRGEAIFRGNTAGCAKCHTVAGTGGDIGPDLSQIGRKYERAALLETILDPSKAIAPEYVPQLAETDAGQVFVGFLVEKTDQNVTLKDAEGRLVRIPAAEVIALEAQNKSLMPELLLREATGQDAADLLAYLTSLRDAVVQVGRFRVLGPLNGRRGGLDHAYEVERDLVHVDFAAPLDGPGGKPVAWEVVAAAPAGESPRFAMLDLAARCRQHSVRLAGAVHYLAVAIESPAEQPATLLVGSDDGCRLWLNGREIHRVDAHRALEYAQDRVAVTLVAGRNMLVMKVLNVDGPSGACLAVESPGLVQLKVD